MGWAVMAGAAAFGDQLGPQHFGFRVGPLNLELRGVYASGDKASANLNKDMKYMQLYQTGGGYFNGFGETSGSALRSFDGNLTPIASRNVRGGSAPRRPMIMVALTRSSPSRVSSQIA